MIRLLLVEHPEAVRRALRARLSLEHDLVQVGETGDAQSAIRLAEHLRPDVVLIDAEMPFLDLTSTVRAIRERTPLSKILVLTQDASPLASALKGLLVGLVAKHEGTAALPPAIRAMAAVGRPDGASNSLAQRRERPVDLPIRGLALTGQWCAHVDPCSMARGALNGQTAADRLGPLVH